ncbi:ead/Ea22-like family protein [Salmonella enterica]|uniref:ead/Ea22-like family protein n=1 Tax=Salmonella enterica TaxID=28901 RepID=UPI003529959B
MQEVKIYTASPSDLSPPVQSESFCVDMVLASDYAELEAKCAALAAKLSMINDLMEAAEQANKLAQEAIETLVQERNALAAENSALKKSKAEFNEYCRRECEDVGDTWVDDFTETPATDAFLAEVRAQGVEMFADKYRAQLTALPTTPENIFDAAHVSLRYQIFDADEFAAQLRKEAAQ